MKLQASSAFEPEACNLKSLITPETDSCSVAYALFTADHLLEAFGAGRRRPTSLQFWLARTRLLPQRL